MYEGPTPSDGVPGLVPALQTVGRWLSLPPTDLAGWHGWVKELSAALGALDLTKLDADSDLRRWVDHLRELVEERHAELYQLAPWLEPLEALNAEVHRPADAARWSELFALLTRVGSPRELAEAAARSPASTTRWRWCPGAGRCSST